MAAPSAFNITHSKPIKATLNIRSRTFTCDKESPDEVKHKLTTDRQSEQSEQLVTD